MAKKQTEWGILTGDWVRRATDVTDCLIGEGYNYLSFSINNVADPKSRKKIVLGLKVEVPEAERTRAVNNIKSALVEKTVSNSDRKSKYSFLEGTPDRQIDIPITVGETEKLFRIYVKPLKSGGSGGGAAQTAINECTFAVYASLRYNVIKADLDPELGISEDHWNEAFNYCRLDKSKERIGVPDMLWHVSHCAGANKLHQRVTMKGTGNVIFYRGKDIDGQKTVKGSLSKAFNRVKSEIGGVSEDKWNPADVWMSVDGFTSDLDSKPFIDDVNDYILKLAGTITTNKISDATLVGISLKKLGANANFSILNAGSSQDRKDAAKSIKFINKNQQGGYQLFFENRGANPIDFYLYYSSGFYDKFQCRNFGGKKASWQIELKGATAAHGRVGGEQVANIVNKITKKTAFPWKNQTFHSQCAKLPPAQANKITKEIVDLLIDFGAQNIKKGDPIPKDRDQYTLEVSQKEQEWRYSKLNGLRFLKALGDNPEHADQIVQSLYLYASSQLDKSSLFVKIY